MQTVQHLVPPPTVSSETFTLHYIDNKMEEIWGANLTLQYHFDGLGAFKPYIGAGLSYNYNDDAQNYANLIGHTVKADKHNIGVILQAGFDYDLTDNIVFNADVKKSWADYASYLEADEWTIGVGFGLRF